MLLSDFVLQGSTSFRNWLRPGKEMIRERNGVSELTRRSWETFGILFSKVTLSFLTVLPVTLALRSESFYWSASAAHVLHRNTFKWRIGEHAAAHSGV